MKKVYSEGPEIIRNADLRLRVQVTIMREQLNGWGVSLMIFDELLELHCGKNWEASLVGQAKALQFICDFAAKHYIAFKLDE